MVLRFVIVCLSFCVFFAPYTADSQEPLGSSTAAESQGREGKILERITVLGGKENQERVPGSSYFLSEEELEQAKIGFDDINRILRDIPGVNIQEEDGYGLRPNIGFRGTSVERSDSITLMEDGVLIAPAPYSAPAAYYFPTAGRMEAIEVMKGASQIKYGPRTIGGSLNMLSTSIPREFSLKADLGAGNDDTIKAHVRGGGSFEYGGFMLETYQLETDGFKKLDGGGDTGFDLHDYVGKLRLNTDPNSEFYQEVELKLGYYEQDSNETYLGLTQEDFDDDHVRRYRASQLDNLDVEHEQYQVRHYIELASNLDLTTTFYRNNTDRNWYKLDSVGGKSISSILDKPELSPDEMDWIKGGNSPDDALGVRENKRSYYSEGIQSTLAYEFEALKTGHKMEFGARYHEDEEDRFQQDDLYRMDNGTMVLTTAGLPGSNANRIGSAEAWAFYLQDQISISDFTFTPGLRYEYIDYTREDYGKKDPDRSGIELAKNSNKLDVFIPGIGAHYQINQDWGAFLGVHKGFSPPGPTSDNSVKEEESVNYEFGANFAKGAFGSEVVLFYNDYDNLLGADTLSSGGTGSGDLFNGGEARAWGVEASFSWDAGKHFDIGVGIPLGVSYTYTNAEFESDFDSEFFGEVQSGDEIPYIAPNVVSLKVGIEHERWGSLYLRPRYVDSMGTAPGSSGVSGSPPTDSYFVLDATAEVPVMEKARLFVDLLNILDEEYVVARRPAGARPGLPFTFLAGVKIAL